MKFPDFALEELQRWSLQVTLQNAATASWASWPSSSSMPCEMLWQVPDEIMAIIPQKIKKHLPYHQTQLIIDRNIDLVDLFAGQARITRWATCGGLKAIAMDKTYGDHMNLLEPAGLALTILLVLRIKENGLLTAGPQCSSWVWLSRKVTKRSSQNPLGDSAVAAVQDGNNVN